MKLTNFLLILLAHIFISNCNGEFVFPDVTLQAFKPKGFIVKVPDIEGMRLFAFHGNLNKKINQIEPGELYNDTLRPVNNEWSYFNPDLKLKIGDEINYWMFIQHETLGYRRDQQKWKVPELLDLSLMSTTCQRSSTKVSGKSFVCKGALIFQDKFNGNNLDRTKWLVEHYIPTSGPDFEFCSYQNRADVCYLKNNNLYLRPIPAETEADVRGELNLLDGCTRQTQDECKLKHDSGFILPPVTSAKINSKLKFTFGTIEIRAKLPSGDWLYPEIYLESVTDPTNKLVIAYSRGNNMLRGNDKEDIGGRLLFGGPMFHSSEPKRSTHLMSKKNLQPFSSSFHTYTVVWTPDKITYLLDGNPYGESTETAPSKLSNQSFRVTLGVGVGGVNDFPNDFLSGTIAKPWRNLERLQVKNFWNGRADWKSTWLHENEALQVDYIKITAL